MINVKDLKNIDTQIFTGVDFSNFNGLADIEGFSFDNSKQYVALPGFCDVHVHFRGPGFLYKESIFSGSVASARGGYTAVCTMPNLNPVPDSVENLSIQQQIIDKSAVIKVYPYGSITVGQKGEKLSDMDGMAKAGAIAFSDDGKGVQSDELMQSAMSKAKELNKLLVAHCEVNSLLNGGYVHKGEYALKNGHKGISSESEYLQIERDIQLVKKTGCSYHVCHVSAKESVEIIRKAKKDGVDVTCETAPHYLTLDDSCLQEDGRFKMNPPLRSKKDKDALIEGILDGTIDMIATDHAPHSQEEKAKGLKDSLFGVVGIETAFPVLYTYLVKEGVISLQDLVKLLAINPRKRFSIPYDGSFSVWDLNQSFTVEPREFLSKGRATPYEGLKLNAENVLTVMDQKAVFVKRQ